MATIKAILCWCAALLGASLVYVLAWSLIAVVWVNLGGKAESAYTLAVLVSTASALVVGSFIAPRPHWKFAFVVLAALASFMPIWLGVQAIIVGSFKSINIIDAGFTFIGIFIAYRSISAGLAGRKIVRTP